MAGGSSTSTPTTSSSGSQRRANPLAKISDMLSWLNEFLTPLIEFSQRFRGFLAVVAFFILAGIFLVTFLFPQGTLGSISDNLDRLTPELFFRFLVIGLSAIFGIIVTLILLSHRETELRADERFVLTALVHEAGDVTEAIHGATVTLVTDEAITQATNAGGATSFSFDRRWQYQDCKISAKHPDYAAREPITVKLGQLDRIPIPLTRRDAVTTPPQQPESERETQELPELAGREVFLCGSSEDAAALEDLALTLQENHFAVVATESLLPQASIDIRIEQAIRRATYVIVAVSRSSERIPGLQSLVAFAADQEKTIVPVRLEPGIQSFVKGLERQRIELSQGPGATHELFQLLNELERVRQSTFDSSAIYRPRLQLLPVNASPFVYGSSVREDLFIGREAMLSAIQSRIGGELQSVSVVANRRMGRTSLLNYLAKRHSFLLPGQHRWVVVYLDMMDVRAHSVTGIMRVLRRGIASQLGRDPWDEQYDGQLWAMAEAFEDLDAQGIRLVLCLDEWETVMARPELDSFIEQLRASGSMARLGMVVATTYELCDLTTSGGLSSPFYNIFETYYLGMMPDPEISRLVERAYQRGGCAVHPAEIKLVKDLSGGHPYLAQLAGSLLWEARNASGSWDERRLRLRFAQKAQPTFTSLWLRMDEMQKRIVNALARQSDEADAPRDSWEYLRRRGVITQDDALFCTPFAEYVVAQEYETTRSAALAG